MALPAPSRGTDGPALSSRAVTPNDGADLPNGAARALLVTVAGDVSFIDMDGNTVTLPAVPAYTVIPIAAVRVRVTGTTATVRTLD